MTYIYHMNWLVRYNAFDTTGVVLHVLREQGYGHCDKKLAHNCALSYARASQGHGQRVGLSVTRWYLLKTNNRRIMWFSRVHRRVTWGGGIAFLRQTFIPWILGTPDANPDHGNPPVEKLHVSVPLCHP